MKPRLLNGEPITQKRRPPSKNTVWRIIAVMAATLFLLFIYYTCIGFGLAQPVMIIYMVIPAGLLIAYLIYNRGFVYKDVTPDMLPAEWSEERKSEILENSRVRAERSKWILAVLIPFVLVLLADALYLYVWCDFLKPFFTA